MPRTPDLDATGRGENPDYLDTRAAVDDFGYPEPPEPVGTLDDALGLCGQLRDELKAVNVSGMDANVVPYHWMATKLVAALEEVLGEGIQTDNANHPEES